jgi:hypothetical protein
VIRLQYRFCTAIQPTLVAALLAAAAGPVARAQQGETRDILDAAPTVAQQCSGPLGPLLPDCQASKNTINILTANPLNAMAGPAGARIASPRPPLEREPASPGVVAEPPNEFQRFVASSTGILLPIFGASLFERVPTTFAPLDRVPVTADYVVGPGDEILLRVWGQVNLDASLIVDRAGAIFVPQAGNISVAGIEYRQLSGFLRSQLERVFRNFDLNVNMGQLRSIQIFVMGQARRPGTYTVSSLSTLVNALFASGGPSSQGSMRHIQR